jgi:hypothetical protein
MNYGNLFYFNGNKCTHFNKKNTEGKIRISLDFRVILLKDYLTYINSNQITFTNPKNSGRNPTKMIIGGYYQMCFKNNIDNIYNNWFNQNDLISLKLIFILIIYKEILLKKLQRNQFKKVVLTMLVV